MVAQLPPEVMGVAVGVLIYSFLCLASGVLLLWLVCVYDERKSYVAMLGAFVSLHTLASIAQQIHTIARWCDIKTEQHANIVANVGNPELNITGASTGLDLVLFYILIGCFARGAIMLLAILGRYAHSRLTLATWNSPHSHTQTMSGGGNVTHNTHVTAGANGRRSTRSPRVGIYDKWLVPRFSLAFCALSLFQIIVISFQLRAAAETPETPPSRFPFAPPPPPPFVCDARKYIGKRLSRAARQGWRRERDEEGGRRRARVLAASAHPEYGS
ncbi:hypothetical protein NEMBOFW57_009399 [Staphylotrichum longicolle]|uniref:Uncharacterized protein n=1 Tax=Staphylotrichum longicolle TaxID=669026 RepID=A0AAD4EP00_9PEZI|nr:hypothetical protein NEMBOFW57_009399 [Staphylotrichum longicolle]